MLTLLEEKFRAMIIADPPPLGIEDQARIERHWSYIATVYTSDPHRALILLELLAATYRYESIAAGDILLSVDSNLHGTLVPAP